MGCSQETKIAVEFILWVERFWGAEGSARKNNLKQNINLCNYGVHTLYMGFFWRGWGEGSVVCFLVCLTMLKQLPLTSFICLFLNSAVTSFPFEGECTDIDYVKCEGIQCREHHTLDVWEIHSDFCLGGIFLRISYLDLKK